MGRISNPESVLGSAHLPRSLIKEYTRQIYLIIISRLYFIVFVVDKDEKLTNYEEFLRQIYVLRTFSVMNARLIHGGYSLDIVTLNLL